MLYVDATWMVRGDIEHQVSIWRWTANKRSRLTPPSLGRLTAWLADRRRNPMSINSHGNRRPPGDLRIRPAKCVFRFRKSGSKHPICRMNVRRLAMVGRNWSQPDAALPRGPPQYGQKATSPNIAKIFWRPCDLVHLLYACRCHRRGVHGDDQTWSSIMPIMFDVLYREFCRARLAEMRKQLLLWPGTPAVPEKNREAGYPDNATNDDATNRGIGLGPSQEWDRHPERSHA
jgi:hypothetical protein